MKIAPIETERLRLRGFEKADALFAIGIWNDPEMGQYLPDPALETIDPAYLHMVEALGEDEACCYLIAEKKDTQERIGTCSFIPQNGGASYDIAYCVHKSHWGRGYATEMARGMIAHAAAQGAGKITVDVNRENAASNHIVQKLGFAPVGERTYTKKGTDRLFTDIRYERNL